jgi:hypothetical protein
MHDSMYVVRKLLSLEKWMTLVLVIMELRSSAVFKVFVTVTEARAAHTKILKCIMFWFLK